MLAVQSLTLHSWAERIHVIGPGGKLGYFLGTKFLEALLNKTGAILVLICIYLVSLILLTGLHPIEFSRGLYQYFIQWLRARKEQKEKATEKLSAREQRRRERDDRLAKLDVEGSGDSEAKKPARKRILAKKSAAPKTFENEEPQTELPLREIPTPQIIDASQRRRPSADIGARPFEKKKQEHSGLSTDEFEHYELPGFDLLDIPEHDEPEVEADQSEMVATQKTIVDTLKAFGVEVTAGNITRGPTITRYEVYP